MVYVFWRIYEYGLYIMHDLSLSLSLGLTRDVIWWMKFVIKQIGIVEYDVMENVLYYF